MGCWIRGPIVGRGSSATVSLAFAGEEVLAVKSAELARSQFLQREQGILSELASPRIVRYLGHDITDENGETFFNLMMEYVEGGSLSDFVNRRGGRLEESEMRSVTRAVLQGLSYLHGKGLVHCDIKGQNILMAPDGPKIADLGCARWLHSHSDHPIAGTPLYMAPEVARGEEQGFPADLWALGCTLIQMATGRAPWPDVLHPVSALYRIAYSSDLPHFPPCLSDQATDFLDKCLRRNPDQRWTADQLLKHPFVDDSAKHTHSDKKCFPIPTYSPTSILDQPFWDSLDESETEYVPTHVQLLPTGQSTDERLRILGGVGGGGVAGDSPASSPDWTWGEEDWITVRRNEEVDISSSDTEVDRIPADEQSSGSSNFSRHIEEEQGTGNSHPLLINEEQLEMEFPFSRFVNIPSHPATVQTVQGAANTEVDTTCTATNIILYCSPTENTSFCNLSSLSKLHYDLRLPFIFQSQVAIPHKICSSTK